MSNRIIWFMFTIMIVVIVATVNAQQEAPRDYPTLAALHNTDLPVRDRVALAQQIDGVRTITPPPATAPERQVGERAIFRATDTSNDRAFEIPAVLVAKGDHIYLWVEDGADVNPADIQALSAAFDERIYEPVRALWGSEASPGVDGDPRVHGLFAHDLGAGTAAYFISEHAYPVEAVPTSNEHEMFFFNLDAISVPMDLRRIESILAHEFQHMIRHHIQANEEYWLNEGFSEFTQFYLYDLPIWEVMAFLANPDTQLNDWSEDYGSRSQHYGASLLFTTYFYDRYGLEALQAVSADPSSRAFDAINRVLADLDEPNVDVLFADWVLANLLFDTSIGSGHFGYESISSNVVSASIRETITRYPWRSEGRLPQYATDYIVLDNLNDRATVTVRLSAPPVVRLVDTEAASGQYMWYSNEGDMSSTTLRRSFDLRRVDSATLHFRLWHHIEHLWDYGYVMVSTDSGATWTPLAGQHTTTENPHSTAYGPGYTGTSGSGDTPQWVDETISLDAYAGQQILLRFQVITDDAITQPGMLVDDIRIPEINYASDLETNGGGWLPDGWVRIDNVLPQQVWVQAVEHSERGDVTITRWRGPISGEWTLELGDYVDRVTLAISPFAPVTTVPVNYHVQVNVE